MLFSFRPCRVLCRGYLIHWGVGLELSNAPRTSMVGEAFQSPTVKAWLSIMPSNELNRTARLEAS